MIVKKFPIEAGHILLFARSIGDENQIYYDEEYANTTEPGEIIAPPTFVTAAMQFDTVFPYRPQPGKPWFGSGKTPTGVTQADDDGIARGLHAEEIFEIHRNLVPGDVLHGETVMGKSWEKLGRRGGKLIFTEKVTEFLDQNNEAAVTVRRVMVVTEKAPEE